MMEVSERERWLVGAAAQALHRLKRDTDTYRLLEAALRPYGDKGVRGRPTTNVGK